MKRLIILSMVVTMLTFMVFSGISMGKKGGGGKPPKDEDPPPDPNPAIVYEGGVGIKVANADGTNQTVLLALDTLPEGTYLRRPSWSPDGLMIVFESNLDEGQRGLYTVRIDLVTGEAIGLPVLVALTSGFSPYPAWSPVQTADGKFKIAYDEAGDIYLVNPDGTGNVNLTMTPYIDESTPTWSPTSDRIAVISYYTDIEVLEIGLNVSMELEVSSRISLILGSESPLEDSVSITSLDWTRTIEIDEIALSARMPNEGNSDIWVIPVANPGDAFNLTGNPDVLHTQPSWSPGDTQLVYRQSGSNLCGKKGNKRESSITIRNLNGSAINGCEENAIIKGGLSPDWRRNAM